MKELVGWVIFFVFIAFVIIYYILKAWGERNINELIKTMQEIITKQIENLVNIIISIREDDLKNEQIVMEIDLRCFAIITYLKVPVDLQEALANLPEGRKEIVTEIFWQACNRCSPEVWAEIYFESFVEKDEKIAALCDIINLLNLDLKEKVLQMAQIKLEDYKSRCLARYEDTDELERIHAEIMHIISAMPSRKVWLGVEMN